MVYSWKPWPLPAPVNVLYLIARQYAICWVLALVLVLGTGTLISVTLGATHARPVIALFFPVGYAVLAEESARWIYALHAERKVKDAIIFMVVIVVFEGTLRAYINAQFTHGHFNVLQVIIFAIGQYILLNFLHIFNSGILIFWVRFIRLRFAWYGFTLCCLLHYAWNISAAVQAFYLKWMNWLLAAVE
jgi:hypothetical protein